ACSDAISRRSSLTALSTPAARALVKAGPSVDADETRDAVQAEIAFREEPRGRAPGDHLAELVPVVCRDQHDSGRGGLRGEIACEHDSVLVGELHVDERDVGLEGRSELESLASASRTTDDIDPLGFQESGGRREELFAV